MKIYLSILIACLFFACGESSKPSPERVYRVVKKQLYQLNIENSSVTWDRHLIQGKSTSTIKLFGKETTVELDGLDMHTDGKIDLKEGDCTYANNKFSKGKITFDFSTLRIASSQQSDNKDLFQVDVYNESKLSINSIEEKDGLGMARGNLTIAEKEKTIFFPIEMVQTDQSLSLNGTILLNTLDWELRSPEQSDHIEKDEITVSLNLNFDLVKEGMDATH